MGKKDDKAGNKTRYKKGRHRKNKRGNEKRERESEKYLHITLSGCYALKY